MKFFKLADASYSQILAAYRQALEELAPEYEKLPEVATNPVGKYVGAGTGAIVGAMVARPLMDHSQLAENFKNPKLRAAAYLGAAALGAFAGSRKLPLDAKDDVGEDLRVRTAQRVHELVGNINYEKLKQEDPVLAAKLSLKKRVVWDPREILQSNLR